MLKPVYLACGLLCIGLGVIGIALPLLPTVPFFILAAWCFARSSPPLENWLLGHPRFGPHIHLWRERGAISRRGKQAALVAFATSFLISVVLLPWPWPLATLAAAVILGSWITMRSEE